MAHEGHHTLSLYNGQIFRKSQPPLKNFFKEERNGAVGKGFRWSISALRGQNGKIVPLKYPHTYLLPNFFENYNPVWKNFFEKPIYTLLYHRLVYAKFETPIGFEAANRKLPARLKVIKRACFLCLTTVESRLERLYNFMRTCVHRFSDTQKTQPLAKGPAQ